MKTASRRSFGLNLCWWFPSTGHWYPMGRPSINGAISVHGLRNDVKDLLLTFPKEPKSLTEIISRAVQCDNRLFERCSEWQLEMSRTRSEPTYVSVVARPSPKDLYNASYANMPRPMETTQHVVVDYCRKRKNNDVEQITYVDIVVV